MTFQASDDSTTASSTGEIADGDEGGSVEQSSSQVIVLGASNVTLSLPWLMQNLPRGFPGRLDLFVASGLGRSYGARSSVLIRELPGILQSTMWQAIADHDAAYQRRYGLITDIGNDLLYGFTVDQIRAWLSDAIRRLKGLDAECIMTQLPLKSVLKMSSSRFYATRTLFFPGSMVTWPKMKQRARELDELVQDLGRQYGIAVIEPHDDWYGFDPIHVRWTKRCEAWRYIVSHWSGWKDETAFQPPPLGTVVRNWTFAAENRKLAKIPRTRTQPVYCDDRLSIRLY